MRGKRTPLLGGEGDCCVYVCVQTAKRQALTVEWRAPCLSLPVVMKRWRGNCSTDRCVCSLGDVAAANRGNTCRQLA